MLHERLRETLAISGKTQAQLAAAIGVSTAAVSQWMSGTVKSLRSNTAAKIEAVTGVRATWIATGKGPKLIGDESPIVAAAMSMTRVPLITYDQALLWGTKSGQDPEAAVWLFTTQKLSKAAFALEIRDSSMRPVFVPGDQIIADPVIAPRPGDYVVAQGGEEVWFKKYRSTGADPQGGELFELISLSPDYLPIQGNPSQIRIVGTMVEHRQYRHQ